MMSTDMNVVLEFLSDFVLGVESPLLCYLKVNNVLTTTSCMPLRS